MAPPSHSIGLEEKHSALLLWPKDTASGKGTFFLITFLAYAMDTAMARRRHGFLVSFYMGCFSRPLYR
jgi:hypothetical protein